MNNKPSSAIVTGAGFSGMSAAIILAKHGHKVTLIEKAPSAGLAIRGFSKNGVYFDSGVHYMGELSENGILRAYFNYLGLDDLQYAAFDDKIFETFRFGDGQSLSLPIGYEPMLDALCAAFPDESKGLKSYLQELLTAYHASPFHTFNGDFRTSGDFNHRWLVSLENMLGQHIHSDRLKTILAAPCLLYGTPPAEAPFLMHARVTGSHFDSVKNIAGGGRALVMSCERRLRELGVNLRCGHSVTKITFSAAGTISGVELENGEHVAGALVVYSGHPAYLPDMVAENTFKPSYSRRLRNLSDSCSAYALFYSTENAPEVLRNRNLMFCPQDNVFDGAFANGRDLTRGPFFLLTGAMPPTTGDMPHKTHVAAFMLSDNHEYRPFYGTKRGRRPQAYQALKRERLGQIQETIMGANPDLAGLKLETGATPLTVHDWLNSPGGGLYGARNSLAQFNPQPVTKVPGLYLAGQSVLVPGIMGVTISAFLTCGYILGHEILLKEVKACKKGV